MLVSLTPVAHYSVQSLDYSIRKFPVVTTCPRCCLQLMFESLLSVAEAEVCIWSEIAGAIKTQKLVCFGGYSLNYSFKLTCMLTTRVTKNLNTMWSIGIKAEHCNIR